MPCDSATLPHLITVQAKFLNRKQICTARADLGAAQCTRSGPALLKNDAWVVSWTQCGMAMKGTATVHQKASEAADHMLSAHLSCVCEEACYCHRWEEA